jgi:hypothetical protein
MRTFWQGHIDGRDSRCPAAGGLKQARWRVPDRSVVPDAFRGTGGKDQEQLGHRQLIYRVTDGLLDDLPQPAPGSGMGMLVAVQGSRGLL